MTELRVLCLLALALYAGSSPAMPSIEDYGMLPQVSQMVISPDGERIAYRNTESDDKDYPWVDRRRRIARVHSK